MLTFNLKYFNIWSTFFSECIVGWEKQNLEKERINWQKRFFPLSTVCKCALRTTCRCSHCLSTEQDLFLHYSVIFNESKWRAFQLHPFSLLPKCICQGFLAVCACELLHHKEISLCLTFCNLCSSLLLSVSYI